MLISRSFLEFLAIIMCLSHCLELALKNALGDFIAPVDESLHHLHYLYQELSKKLHKLKIFILL